LLKQRAERYKPFISSRYVSKNGCEWGSTHARTNQRRTSLIRQWLDFKPFLDEDSAFGQGFPWHFIENIETTSTTKSIENGHNSRDLEQQESGFYDFFEENQTNSTPTNINSDPYSNNSNFTLHELTNELNNSFRNQMGGIEEAPVNNSRDNIFEYLLPRIESKQVTSATLSHTSNPMTTSNNWTINSGKLPKFVVYIIVFLSIYIGKVGNKYSMKEK